MYLYFLFIDEQMKDLQKSTCGVYILVFKHPRNTDMTHLNI